MSTACTQSNNIVTIIVQFAYDKRVYFGLTAHFSPILTLLLIVTIVHSHEVMKSDERD